VVAALRGRPRIDLTPTVVVLRESLGSRAVPPTRAEPTAFRHGLGLEQAIQRRVAAVLTFLRDAGLHPAV